MNSENFGISSVTDGVQIILTPVEEEKEEDVA